MFGGEQTLLRRRTNWQLKLGVDGYIFHTTSDAQPSIKSVLQIKEEKEKVDLACLSG